MTAAPATITESLTLQKTQNLLAAPAIKPVVDATAGTLSVSLLNSTTSNTVYAYVTGLGVNNDYASYILQSDGVTPYYPPNPSATQTAIGVNYSIALGPVGSTTNITIPYSDGGRIWYSIGSELTFLVNPSSTGAAFVEPSVSNTSDPNYNFQWDFCEFSAGSGGVYVNISYVDFVCIPVALTLTNTSGVVTHVSGLPSDGLDTICSNLIAQNNVDGAGWDQLIIKASDGSNLRVLNPTNGIVFNSSLFENYWTDYVTSCWNNYVSNTLTIDTQSSWGVVTGNTSNDRSSIAFSGIGSFTQPSAADIFGQNSGAFAAQATNTAELLNIGARLSTAINRSTLLTDANQPDGESVASYYTNSVTNHYARIVHAANLDNKGYCFPYDDVGGAGEVDQSGFLSDPSPQNLLVTIGGAGAYVQSKRSISKRSVGSVEATRPLTKRSISWNEDVKERFTEVIEDRDLEKGEHPKLMNELERNGDVQKSALPPILERVFGKYLNQIRSSPFYTSRLQPLLDFINQFLVSFLSLSLRAVLSRIAIILFVLLFYFLGMEPRGSEMETQRQILESAGLISNATIVGQAM